MFDDTGLQLLRASYPVAALERTSCGWKLSHVSQSTRRALKYRRGEGEILIINHDGRGWWDPPRAEPRATSSTWSGISTPVRHSGQASPDPSSRIAGQGTELSRSAARGEEPHRHAADCGTLEPPPSVTEKAWRRGAT